MPRYDAYIVRIWRSIGMEGQQWTGRVEHIHDKDYQQFSSIDELFGYLRTRVGPEAEISLPIAPHMLEQHAASQQDTGEPNSKANQMEKATTAQ